MKEITEIAQVSTWYHGSTESFEQPDLSKSALSAFHLTDTPEFAADFVIRKADEKGQTAVPVIQEYHVGGKIFDPENPEHLSLIAESLPEKFEYNTAYGYQGVFGSVELTRDEAIYEMQGLKMGVLPAPQQDIDAIRASTGNPPLTEIYGQQAVIQGYDSSSDTAFWISQENYVAAKMVKANLDNARKAFGSDSETFKDMEFVAKEKLSHIVEHQTCLTPRLEQCVENWPILESNEIRPHLKALGFSGALSHAGNDKVLIMFDESAIRRTDDPIFKPRDFTVIDVPGDYIGGTKGVDVYVSGRGVDEAVHVVTSDNPDNTLTMSISLIEKIEAVGGTAGFLGDAIKTLRSDRDFKEEPTTGTDKYLALETKFRELSAAPGR